MDIRREGGSAYTIRTKQQNYNNKNEINYGQYKKFR